MPTPLCRRRLAAKDRRVFDCAVFRSRTVNSIDLVAARMEQARWECGIPTAELALRIGVGRKRLWRVLNGERAMKVDEFVRLCMELGLGWVFI